jgi:thiopurine S-methyltransferase
MTSKYQFWLDLWEQNQTRWHQEHFNPNLEAFLLPRLPATQQTVLVPLCGKSLDMIWLVEKGHRVIGVELSELAVKAFFEDNGLAWQRIEEKNTLYYQSTDIKILVGDFFAMSPHLLDGIRFVYDRAALIALDQPTRALYARALQSYLREGFQVLLLTIEYTGTKSGPPFSVSSSEVRDLFPAPYQVSMLFETEVADLQDQFADQGITSMVERGYWICSTP